MSTITKGAGHTWHVTYQCEDEPEEIMTVWGQMTIEEAIREVRWSFDEEDQPTLVILKAERAPKSST